MIPDKNPCVSGTVPFKHLTLVTKMDYIKLRLNYDRRLLPVSVWPTAGSTAHPSTEALWDAAVKTVPLSSDNRMDKPVPAFWFADAYCHLHLS